MKKKNIGVIGCGKWGKKIIKELKKISNIRFVYNSKDDYKNFEKNIDWIFILTPDTTHYRIAKFFIKKKINVFCEKPLTDKLKQAENLIKLSKYIGSKLYIDDIENYKNKSIKIKKGINYIFRTKKDTGTIKSLLNRLAYHDFYLLSKYVELKNINLIKIIEKKKLLEFKIILKNNIIFHFHYDINSNVKKHLINKISFDNFKNNPLKDMLKSVLYKNKNFKNNNLDALKCIKLIDRIKKIIH
tara:strand:+ start:260 stop:988 length:729 start_codon:yes stop_codon:yes gene_type:complete